MLRGKYFDDCIFLIGKSKYKSNLFHNANVKTHSEMEDFDINIFMMQCFKSIFNLSKFYGIT